MNLPASKTMALNQKGYNFRCRRGRHLYIAEGFVNDCDKLIQRCAQYGTLNYEKFCDIWKEMHFAEIYLGRSSGAEIAELSEEVLHIAKHYMVVGTHSFEETVAGLFLTYALMNLQPYVGFAALRLTPEDVSAIHRIEATARQQRRCDVLYILGSVLIKGPCQYHAAQRERGMEVPIRKYLEGDVVLEKLGSLQRGVFYRQDEEFNIIKELNTLSKSYSEVKAAVVGPNTKTVDRSLNYVKADLATELDTSLRRLLSGAAAEDRIACEDTTKAEEMACVQSIKERAMKNVVNPMKHLTGLKERKLEGKLAKSPVNKPEIKPTKGKVKSGSPVKALATSSPRKRKAPQKKPRTKKKPVAERKNDSDEPLNISSDEETNAELNIDEFFKVNTDKGINIELESLPAFIRSETNGTRYEIEIIDHLPKENKSKSIKASEDLKDSKTEKKEPKVPREDVPTVSKRKKVDKVKSEKGLFKVPNKVPQKGKREQKKSVLMSKFKRMGMLPVANFKDSQ